VTLSTTTDLVAVGATTNAVCKIRGALGSTATTTFALVPALSQTANIIDIYNPRACFHRCLLQAAASAWAQRRPPATLGVQGNALISGNIIGANIIATGTLSAPTVDCDEPQRRQPLGILFGTNGVVGTTATNTLGLLASSSLTASAPLSYNVASGNFSISQSGALTDGYLSSDRLEQL